MPCSNTTPAGPLSWLSTLDIQDSCCPLPRGGRGMQGWVVILKLLAVGAAAHRVGLPADQARAREHAGVDGGARPLALEDGGDLAAEAAARLRGHARGGRG